MTEVRAMFDEAERRPRAAVRDWDLLEVLGAELSQASGTATSPAAREILRDAAGMLRSDRGRLAAGQGVMTVTTGASTKSRRVLCDRNASISPATAARSEESTP